jgi:hypothetical protein
MTRIHISIWIRVKLMEDNLKNRVARHLSGCSAPAEFTNTHSALTSVRNSRPIVYCPNRYHTRLFMQTQLLKFHKTLFPIIISQNSEYPSPKIPICTTPHSNRDSHSLPLIRYLNLLGITIQSFQSIYIPKIIILNIEFNNLHNSAQ